jgi:hypothetical protein
LVPSIPDTGHGRRDVGGPERLALRREREIEHGIGGLVEVDIQSALGVLRRLWREFSEALRDGSCFLGKSVIRHDTVG